MKKFNIGDVVKVSVKKTEKTGVIRNIIGEYIKIVLLDEKDGELYTFKEDKLEYVEPVVINKDDLRSFCRYEISYDELMHGKPYAYAIFDEDYIITTDDIDMAIHNHILKNEDLDSFKENWFVKIYNNLYNFVGLDKIFQVSINDDVTDFPEDKHVVSDCIFIMSQIFIDKTDIFKLDDVVNEISIYLENKDKPILEKEFTTFQKSFFLMYWLETGRIDKADGDIKKKLKIYIDERCLENDVYTLRYKAFACYNKGNPIYGTDYHVAEQCLEKLMEKAPEPVYAEMLGCIYYFGKCNGGVPDYDKAFKCFSIGADAMLPESTFRLSDMYCNGQGVWQDEILGTSVLKRIYIELLHDVTNNNISEDFADIAYRMGNIARFGIGTADIDLTFAYFFYLQAKFAISSREINTPDRVKLYNDIEMAMGDIKPMVEQAENDRIKLANDSLSSSLDAIIHLGFENGYMKLKYNYPTMDNLKLNITFYKDRGCTVRRKIFVTIPQFDFCGYVDNFNIEAKNVKIFEDYQMDEEEEDVSSVIEFSDIENGFFLIDGVAVARLDADMYLVNTFNKN